MSDEEEKSIKILGTFEFRQKTKNYNKIDLEDVTATKIVLNLITKLQKENEEKDKQIDLMAEYINEIDVSEDICEGRTMCDEDCEKCIKQYFAGLVEKE